MNRDRKETYSLISCAEERTVLSEIERADGLWQLLIGLLGRTTVSNCRSILLPNTRTIHTFGMGYALDVLFMDAENRCVGKALNVVPSRIVTGPRTTLHTLETKAGQPSVFADVRIGELVRLEAIRPNSRNEEPTERIY